MDSSRPFASLSAGLLARKGQAKPAMRPFRESSHNDLGWNDMGHDAAPAVASPVREQQEQLAAEFVEASKPRVEKCKPAGRITVPVTAPITPVALVPLGKKAAFTLRLDAERHLRLRLASAVANRSAQQLVVEALDSFLGTIPQLDDLARHAPSGLSNRQ